MNDLIKLDDESSSKMNSVQLVDIINEYRKIEGNDSVLQHSHFLQKIEKELNGDEANFRSTYLDGANRNSKCYLLPKDECILMLMSESRIVRKGVLVKLNELENKTQFEIPKTFSEALKLASSQAEKIEQQQLLISYNAPKVAFFDQVTGSNDCFDMADVAKVCNLGVGRNTLFLFLRESKILRDNNTPYQQYIDSGYFRVIESKYSKPNGDININLKTVVYQKGIDFIIKRYVGRNLKKE